jgi:hypothetical protein
VDVVAGDTHIRYLPPRNHAVIRRGALPDVLHASPIRHQFLYPRDLASQRGIRLAGSGEVAGRATDRYQGEFDGVNLIIDVDRESGLILRRERLAPHGGPQTVEWDYDLVERLPRRVLTPQRLNPALPSGVLVEEYDERAAEAAERPPAPPPLPGPLLDTGPGSR